LCCGTKVRGSSSSDSSEDCILKSIISINAAGVVLWHQGA
jgi:hypothetical protein